MRFSVLVLKKLKTLIIQVSFNVFSFPHIGYCARILASLYVTNSKQSKYLCLVMLFCFYIKRGVWGILEFSYVGTLKTLKRNVFGNVVLPSYIGCFPYLSNFLVPNTLIKTKRHISKSLVYFTNIGEFTYILPF